MPPLSSALSKSHQIWNRVLMYEKATDFAMRSFTSKNTTSKRTLFMGLALFAFVLYFYAIPHILALGSAGSKPSHNLLQTRRDEISDAFQHAWDGYTKHCFGHDNIKPVSNTCEDAFAGWGASAVDALSTAIMMEKEDVVVQILTFIAGINLDVVHGGDKIQIFEIIIRYLGGMISAWDLLTGPYQHLAKDEHLRIRLYEQMVSLGDRLARAFDTPSGVPRDYVNPVTGETDESIKTYLTTAGTNILEFARLSTITGNKTYVKLADRAESYMLDPYPSFSEPFPGLLGSYIRIDDGRIHGYSGSWGAFSDSFYEYLIKAYIYDSTTYGRYRDRWLLAADSTIQHIGSHAYGHDSLTFLGSWDLNITSNRMETLSWFAGGNFILGGLVMQNQTLVDFGLSIADAAAKVYEMTATGLAGEWIAWDTECGEVSGVYCTAEDSIRITDARYQMRPEVLETWYHAYRATSNPKYLDWSWKAFQALNKVCKTDTGFSGINDVNEVDGGGKSDHQESFLFAEVLKYLWLIHAEDKDVPFQIQDSRIGGRNEWVLNTEAHPLHVAGPAV